MITKLLTVISTLLSLLLLIQVQPLSASLTISNNRRYIQTGTFTFTITSSSSNSLTSTITYLYLPAYTPKLGYLVMNFLNYQFSNNAIDLNLTVSNLNQVSMQTTLTSGSLTRIVEFQIRYYIAQPQYGGLPSFSSYSGNSFISRNITTSNPYSYTFTGLSNLLNMVGGVKTFFSFTGITANSWNNNAIDLSLNIVQQSATSVTVTVSVISSTIYVSKVSYIWMSYNDLDVNKNNYGSFTLQTITANNGGTLRYSSANPIIYDFNTIVGLTAIKISGQSNFQFSTNINSNTQLSITASYGFARLDFNVLIVQTYYCKYDAPYLYNNICYEICPTRTYAVESQLVCNTCPYDCYTCTTNGLCLTCNVTTDFRQFNSTLNRCSPIVGYYESGTTVAGKCSNTCVACVGSASNCSVCINGYFLNVNTCQSCMLNCVSCNSSTTCNNCSVNYVYNTAQPSCQLICSTGCSSCVNSNNNCTACQPSFYLSGTTCQQCMPNCTSCTTSTSCSNCAQGYTLNTQGTACFNQNGSNTNLREMKKQPVSQSNTQSQLPMIIGFVLLAILIIGVGLCICRKISKRVNPQKKLKCQRKPTQGEVCKVCKKQEEIIELQDGNYICQRCLTDIYDKNTKPCSFEQFKRIFKFQNDQILQKNADENDEINNNQQELVSNIGSSDGSNGSLAQMK